MGPITPSPRYKSLDLWRGLACLMVVMDHTAVTLHQGGGAHALKHDAAESWGGFARWLAASFADMAFGPPMFFVISGYCLASALDSARRKGTSAPKFWLRRLWRTFPPFWAAIAFFLGLILLCDLLGAPELYRSGPGILLAPISDLGWRQWVGNLTLTELWRPLGPVPDHRFLHMGVIWTLCYQEQFYVVCALALLLFPRRVHQVLMVVTVLFGIRLILAWDMGAIDRLSGWAPYHWHEFAAGLIVYWRFHGGYGDRGRRILDASLAGMFLASVSVWAYSSIVASAFAMILVALKSRDQWLADVRGLGWLRGIGRRSYSIYLTHLGISVILPSWAAARGLDGFWTLALVVTPAVTAIAIGFGCLFYQLVERRFQELPFARSAAPESESAAAGSASTNAPNRVSDYPEPTPRPARGGLWGVVSDIELAIKSQATPIPLPVLAGSSMNLPTSLANAIAAEAASAVAGSAATMPIPPRKPSPSNPNAASPAQPRKTADDKPASRTESRPQPKPQPQPQPKPKSNSNSPPTPDSPSHRILDLDGSWYG